MKHVRILILIALAMVLLPFQDAFAGVVVTKGGKAKVGEIKKYKDGSVLVSFKVGKISGKIKYKAHDVLWMHDSPKIRSLYDGARAAYAKKQFKVAGLLAKLSMNDPQEGAKRAKAQELLRYVQEVGKKVEKKPAGEEKKEARPTVATAGNTGAADSAAPNAPKVGPKIKVTDEMLQNNKIYKAVSGNATYYNGTSIVDFDSKKFAAARYYVLIFAALKDAGIRDIVRKMKKQYGDMKADFGDHVDFLLIPTDETKETWDAAYPALQVPFPAMKYEKAKTLSFGGSSTTGQFFRVLAIDATGNVVATGEREFDAIQTLREKLEDEVGD